MYFDVIRFWIFCFDISVSDFVAHRCLVLVCAVRYSCMYKYSLFSVFRGNLVTLTLGLQFQYIDSWFQITYLKPIIFFFGLFYIGFSRNFKTEGKFTNIFCVAAEILTRKHINHVKYQYCVINGQYLITYNKLFIDDFVYGWIKNKKSQEDVKTNIFTKISR